MIIGIDILSGGNTNANARRDSMTDVDQVGPTRTFARHFVINLATLSSESPLKESEGYSSEFRKNVKTKMRKRRPPS